MQPDIFKRTTFVFEDANASAQFYEKVFGWKRWYDQSLKVDERFPPTGAPHMEEAYLIIMEVADPIIGKLGLLEYPNQDFKSSLDPNRKTVKPGEPVLVINSQDVDGIYERAKAFGVNVITPPVNWDVPSPDGQSNIKLRTMCMFDINGIYIEASTHR